MASLSFPIFTAGSNEMFLNFCASSECCSLEEFLELFASPIDVQLEGDVRGWLRFVESDCHDGGEREWKEGRWEESGFFASSSKPDRQGVRTLRKSHRGGWGGGREALVRDHPFGTIALLL